MPIDLARRASTKAPASLDGEGRSGERNRRRSVISPEDASRPDRRADILLSAERLFAEHGFNGVSVRDIADDACVPPALVGYYFGKKAELFNTIFERRKGYLEERVARIRAIATDNPHGDLVERIVRAWAEPALAVGEDKASEAFSILVARGMWDAGVANRRAIERHFDELAREFIKAMTKALPRCEPGRLIWGYQYAVGSLLTHIVSSRVVDLSDGREANGGVGRHEELIRFLTQGFHALAGMTGLEPRAPAERDER